MDTVVKNLSGCIGCSAFLLVVAKQLDEHIDWNTFELIGICSHRQTFGKLVGMILISNVLFDKQTVEALDFQKLHSVEARLL